MDINREISILQKRKVTFSSQIIDSDVYILCLPTPLKKNRTCDTSILDNVLKKIIPKLKNNDTVIIESTVPIGFTEIVRKFPFKSRTGSFTTKLSLSDAMSIFA